jgi:predicted nucleic acid-binding protein
VNAVVDSTILVDFLRGNPAAVELLIRERAAAPLEASEMTRLEILAGTRPKEEPVTRQLLSTLIWHPVDQEIAERAGGLARRWLPSHHTIGASDFAIAATALVLGARLLTRNVKHFPMFSDLKSPYGDHHQ